MFLVLPLSVAVFIGYEFYATQKWNIVNWECLVYTFTIMLKDKYEIMPFLDTITYMLPKLSTEIKQAIAV